MAASDEELGGLYDRYGGAAYALALRVIGDARLAEDAVADSFRDLLRPDAAPGSRSPRARLFALVHRRAVAFRRSTAPPAELPVGGGDLLELAYWGGLTHTQLAERLGLPRSTVDRLLREALSDVAALSPR